MTMSLSRAPFYCAFVGAGSAGIGPLVQAACQGRLRSLLSGGIALIDTGRDAWGAGKIGGYMIPANSLAEDFISFVPRAGDLGPHSNGGDLGVFAELREHDAYRALADIAERGEKCSLAQAGAFSHEIGSLLAARVAATPGCMLLPSTSVKQLRIEHASLSSLVVDIGDSAASDGVAASLEAQKVVLATGGYQVTPDYGDAHNAKMLTADLAQQAAGLDDIAARVEANVAAGGRPSVAIIGGSHSAFSTAQLLVGHLGPRVPGFHVDICHKRAVRAFYETTDEADAAGYTAWGPGDVCELTGRVNRFSGIRPPARDFFEAIAGGDEPRAALVPIELAPGASRLRRRAAGAFAAALDDAAAIVGATGYTTNLPAVSAAIGTGAARRYYPLDWCYATDGQVLVSTTSGQVAVEHPAQPHNPTPVNTLFVQNTFSTSSGAAFAQLQGPPVRPGSSFLRRALQNSMTGSWRASLGSAWGTASWTAAPAACGRTG